MGIWLDRDSRIAVQGLTGRNGQFHARQMLDYGTPLVGGVTPGKGGSECLGLPVWDSVAEAVDNGANTSCVFVPPRFAAAAIREAVDAGIRLGPLLRRFKEEIDTPRVAKSFAQNRGSEV